MDPGRKMPDFAPPAHAVLSQKSRQYFSCFTLPYRPPLNQTNHHSNVSQDPFRVL